MKTKRFESLMIFLRLFFVVFLAVYILRVVLVFAWNELYPGMELDKSIDMELIGSAAFALMWSLFSFSKYRNMDMELYVKEYDGKDLTEEVKRICSSMRLKLKKEYDNEVIFRSSLFSHLWGERVFIRIKAESLELKGAVYYLEKIADKLKV